MSWSARLAILAATAAAGWAQTLPSQDPAELVRQLGADDWRARQSAQDALVQMGDAAADLLAATTQSSTDEEARSRATAALLQIAEDRIVGPSRITLHLHNVPPKEAFAQLAAQANAPLEPMTPVFWQQSPAAPISIDVDRVPFWQVMRLLTEKTTVCLQEWGSSLRLANGPLLAGPTFVSGPFLVTADSIDRNQSVVFGPSPDRSDELTLNLQLMAEPKLRVLRMTESATLTEAVDDNGNSLLPDEQADSSNASNDTATWKCTAALKYPKQNHGTRLVRVRGAFHVTLASRMERMTFAHLLRDRPTYKTADGVGVTLKTFTRSPNGQTELALSVLPPGGSANNPDLTDQLSRATTISLLDANNRPLGREFSQIGGDAERIDVTLRFSTTTGEDGLRVGEPDHLVVQLVGATKDLTIPFEFNDLPLP